MSRSSSHTTFPLSAGRLKWRLVRTIAISPTSWLPYMLVLNLWLNLAIGPTVVAISILGITSALILYWGLNMERTKRRIVNRLIRDSNKSQDNELCARAAKLAKGGFHEYSLQLIEFVQLKTKIESAIHKGNRSVSRREEIDTVVDSITFGAADQIEKMAKIDGRIKKKRSKPLPPDVEEHYVQTRDIIAGQMEDAYETLNETWENLGEWFDHSELPSSRHPDMEAAIEHLKTERDLIYRVRDRMNSEWIAEFPETEVFDGNSTRELE